jgi:type II secretory ATPase GspE/PulE/Tfp pilus assembly ATPase PilB-like protein
MKISKSLLSAIVIGIAVQATTSCTKDKEPNDAKAKQEAKKLEEKNNPYSPENCPACGMG